MTRKSTKSASREWSGPRPAPEAVQTPPYGFRIPRQSAIVHADPWSIWGMSVKSISGSIDLANGHLAYCLSQKLHGRNFRNNISNIGVAISRPQTFQRLYCTTC